MGRGADGRVDLDRMLAHAHRFADFDVLYLQEVSAGYPELPGCDGSWELAHPATAHARTVGVHDQIQWPGPPFAWDFVFVSADIAGRVRRLEVDLATDASDHQPMPLELDSRA